MGKVSYPVLMWYTGCGLGMLIDKQLKNNEIRKCFLQSSFHIGALLED